MVYIIDNIIDRMMNYLIVYFMNYLMYINNDGLYNG